MATQTGNPTNIQNIPARFQEALRTVARLNLPIRDRNGKMIVGNPNDSFFGWKDLVTGNTNWTGRKEGEADKNGPWQAGHNGLKDGAEGDKGWKEAVAAQALVEKALELKHLDENQIAQYVYDYNKREGIPVRDIAIIEPASEPLMMLPGKRDNRAYCAQRPHVEPKGPHIRVGLYGLNE
nr:hypothetical protein [Candidatus Burarchaeum sp.]